MINKVCGKSLISFLGLFTICCLLLAVAACGRKGPPTLKAYEKPVSPSNLAAVHREDRVLLTWSYPEGVKTSIKGFEVLRSDDGEFSRIAFVESDKTSFADENFKVEVTYKYKIIARTMKDILSADSNVIMVVPKRLPPVPEDIKVKVESDSLELSWKSAGEDVCYNIYKSSEKGKYADTPINRKPVCTTSFRDGVLSPDITAFYTIRASLNTPIKDEGYASAEVNVDSSQFIPSAPSDVRVIIREGKIYLVWKESQESWTKGYRIYRKIKGEKEFSLLGEVNTPVFKGPVKSGKKATYLIKAFGPSMESEPAIVDVP